LVVKERLFRESESSVSFDARRRARTIKTYSRRAIIPFPRVTVCSDKVDTFLDDDTVIDQIVEIDLVTRHSTQISVTDLDSSSSGEDTRSSRGRNVHRSERVPIDFRNVLVSDTFAGKSRVVVGTDDDGVTFRELVVVGSRGGANIDLLAFRESFEIPLHLASSFSLGLSGKVPLVTFRHESLLTLKLGEVSVRETSRRDRISFVNEGSSRRRRDVSVSGDSHEDLRSGHSSVGPGLDGGNHVRVRLHRIRAGVGERGVGARSRRSWKVTSVSIESVMREKFRTRVTYLPIHRNS